jgi:hypothetical protein
MKISHLYSFIAEYFNLSSGISLQWNSDVGKSLFLKIIILSNAFEVQLKQARWKNCWIMNELVEQHVSIYLILAWHYTEAWLHFSF